MDSISGIYRPIEAYSGKNSLTHLYSFPRTHLLTGRRKRCICHRLQDLFRNLEEVTWWTKYTHQVYLHTIILVWVNLAEVIPTRHATWIKLILTLENYRFTTKGSYYWTRCLGSVYPNVGILLILLRKHSTIRPTYLSIAYSHNFAHSSPYTLFTALSITD